MGPVRDALASETLRKQMAQRLQWKRDKSPGIMPLLSGDRVICKNNQYVAKVGALSHNMHMQLQENYV